MNVLAIIKTLVSLLPVMHQAIKFAEKKFGAGKGTSKLNDAVDAVSKLLPADQVEHADTVKDLLPTAISALVGVMNQNGTLARTAPAKPAGEVPPP
jgi:ABC-type molybdenum transport system ATPase subunit/photorepair protein PhrA